MPKKWLLQDQIRHNRRVTAQLFLVMFVILFALVFSVSYAIFGQPPYITAGFALIFGVVYLWSASNFSVDMILKSARARPANPQIRQEKLLIYKVQEMAIAAGMPAPKVYVQPSKDINAFATGRKPEEGVVCFTEGALQLLDQEELEGVVAHELSHIKNEDIKVGTYAIALIGIIAMIAEMVWWGMIFGRGGNNRRDMDPRMQMILFAVAILLIILAPILSRLTYMAINRRREYLADATGASLTRNPDGLARALAKIGGMEPQEPHKSDRTIASLYLANPFKRTRKQSLFSTHPPIQDRIDRLRRM